MIAKVNKETCVFTFMDVATTKFNDVDSLKMVIISVKLATFMRWGYLYSSAY